MIVGGSEYLQPLWDESPVQGRWTARWWPLTTLSNTPFVLDRKKNCKSYSEKVIYCHS